MKILAIYLADYFRAILRIDLLLTSIFVSLLIYINYSLGIESRIKGIPSSVLEFFLFFLFYATVFSFAYRLQRGFQLPNAKEERFRFIGLIVIGAALFAIKITPWATGPLLSGIGDETLRNYLGKWIQPPLKLGVVFVLLYLTRKCALTEEPFFGFSAKGFYPRPYLYLLLFVIPIVAIASSQTAFLQAYPKLKSVFFIKGHLYPDWLFKILYEISYGLDFVTIEVFFRGFLVIAFAKFAGRNAILPMAVFYCTIHFGKPLMECISSYLGGILLGIFVYNSKSIWGGLILHLGIAWGMECAGYIRLFSLPGHP